MDKTYFVPVPEEEYFTKIGEAVYAVFMKKGFAVSKNESSNKWLTHKEAALYIRKTPAALYKLSSTKEVRYRKRGKSNIYLKEDLDRYMDAGVVATAEEIIGTLQLQPRRKHLTTKK